MGTSLPALCSLERTGTFQETVPGLARAGSRTADGGFDFLQGAPGQRWGAKKNGPQAIGVSRGGLNTKIHAACDALGNPLRFKLTAGNKSDTPELIDLIEGLPGQELLADKAYDSDAIVKVAISKGMEVIIPPKSNRKEKRTFDAVKYKARHLVENLFQRMKVYRRVATRYEKLDNRFLSIVHLVGAMKWIQ
jgi:transposase